MILFESVRQKVITMFKTAHDANYPDTLVNYPNFVVVDLEHQKDPFVSVHLTINEETKQLALGEKELYIVGMLSISYYFLEGKGLSGSYSYVDMLNTAIGLENSDGITYNITKPTNIKTFKGWEGVLSNISFRVPLGADCS